MENKFVLQNKLVGFRPLETDIPETLFFLDNKDAKTFSMFLSDTSGIVRSLKVGKDISIRSGLTMEENDTGISLGIEATEDNPLYTTIITEVDKIMQQATQSIEGMMSRHTLKGNYNGTSEDLKRLIDNLTTLVTSNDDTLNSIQSIVNYIKQNKEILDTLSISNIIGLQDALEGKVNKVLNKELSSNDFTDILKTKLENIDISTLLPLTTYNRDKSTLDNNIRDLYSKIQTNDTNLDTLQETVNELKSIKSHVDDNTRKLTNKVNVELGKGLSSNDFTSTYKNKLDNLDNTLSYKLDKGSYTGSAQDLLNLINNKVTSEVGKGLSSNDFTNQLKTKLENIDLNLVKPQIIKTVDNQERKLKELTLTEYNRLQTKDPNTYYLIFE